MRSKCKACSQIFEIESPVSDGHELVCPYCGAANVYRTPTRIEVPPRTSSCEEVCSPIEENSATPFEPGMQPVSRLHIIRPQNEKDSVLGKGNAMVDRVRSRARAEARRQFFSKIGIVLKDLFWLLVLIALLIGCWRLYRFWKKSSVKAETQSTEIPTRSLPEKIELLPVSVKTPDPAESFPIRLEDAMAQLRNAQVSFYGLLPASERVGTADGLFTIVIPYGDSVARYYGIQSSPTGVVSAIRWIEKPIRRVTQAEYEDELNRQGGFVVRSGIASFVTRPHSPKVWNPPMSASEDFCASKAYFGVAHGIVEKHNWKTDGLLFDITLSFGEKKEPIKVASVRFGEKVPYSRFRKAAEPIARELRARSLPKPKTKNYRRTVVVTDTTLIGTKANGVMKIPRKPPQPSGAENLRWRKLFEEAERQEREARCIASENETKMREWKRQLEAQPSDAEIQKVLMTSSVCITRRTEENK